MFVKIEGYFGDKPLILNVDRIVSISLADGRPRIIMTDGNSYLLQNELQYNQLCEILTKRL